MSLVFSFNATAFGFKPPLPIAITIGWEFVGNKNKYFMFIQKRGEEEKDVYVYHNLDDPNITYPEHLYYLSILIKHQIYIPFNIYQMFLD